MIRLPHCGVYARLRQVLDGFHPREEPFDQRFILGQSRSLMRRFIFLLLALSLLAAGFTLAPPASAQTGGRFYPETGHTLHSRFLDFYDSYGGPDVFGYPITEGFIDPESQRFIQYTENARLEWVEDDGSVQLAPLGELIEGWHPAVESTGDSRGCRYFAEAGHSTCYAFLEYFNRNGGRELFGLPISEFIIQNDRIVQYFQNFRLDWYPEAAVGHQIRVAQLGREHFRQAGYDPAYLQPGTSGDEAGYRVTELRLTASVQSPSIGPDATQQVYLVVRDQNMLPVPNAAVLLIVHQPDRDRYFLMPLTDPQGISRTTFQMQQAAHGSVINLELWVMQGELEAVARDSFTIW
ncbi:MAG: hypothetical protein ACLFWD_12780 [Anaerolineales bacterium]